MRILLGIVVGILGVGLGSATLEYFLNNSRSPGGWIGLSNSNGLAALTAAWFGGLAGSCICGVAAAFGLPFPNSVTLSFGLSLLASFILIKKIGELKALKLIILGFLIFGTIFGALVSRLNESPSGAQLTAESEVRADWLTSPGKEIAEFIWSIPLWQWFVIVPAFLWIKYLSFRIYFHIARRHERKHTKELMERRRGKAERERAERRKTMVREIYGFEEYHNDKK